MQGIWGAVQIAAHTRLHHFIAISQLVRSEIPEKRRIVLSATPAFHSGERASVHRRESRSDPPGQDALPHFPGAG